MLQMSSVQLALSAYPEVRLFIAGKWCEGEEALNVYNPATNSVLGQYPVVSEEQLHEAVQAAEKAMQAWQKFSPQQRSGVLRCAAEKLRQRQSQIAQLMSLEQGKPLAEANAEVERAAEIIEWDAEEGRRLYGRTVVAGPGQRRTIHRYPLGVIAAFSPWNAPLGSPARKISGPLAAGCGVVIKAAEETPACAVALVEAFVDAGVPSGLINLVFGSPQRTADYLIRHPLIRGATFTGSVAVGKELAGLCGRMMKPAVMELGGHAPVIVAADANVRLAATGAISTKIKNAGQICTSPTRFFVARSIADEFVQGLREAARDVRIGSGLDPQSNMGPVATERRLRCLHALVQNAVEEGAEVEELAPAPAGEGYFMGLILLRNVPATARLMQEEPFGPIMVVNPFDKLDDAVHLANSLPYGLAAYAFSESDRTLERLSDGLHCGNLGLNCYLASTADSPLGGVKESGFGREGGAEGLLNYTFVKNVVKLF